MVTLVLDATTADIAMFAIAAHADEREAHAREVERYGADLARRHPMPLSCQAALGSFSGEAGKAMVSS